MRNISKVVLSTVLVPALLAGTCLAAPALAVPAVSNAARAAQTAQQGVELTCGAMVMVVPADFTVTTEDGVVFAYNQEQTIAAYLADVKVPSMPTDPEQIKQIFDESSTQAVEQNGGTIVFEEIGYFSDGSDAYIYCYEVNSGSSCYQVALIYTPYEGGFTFAQVGADSTITAEGEQIVSDIVASVDLVTATIDVPEGYVAASASGIAFALPEGLALDETSTSDEPVWFDEDGTIMIGVLTDLYEPASELTDDDYETLFGIVAESLEGKLATTGTVTAGDITYPVAGFTMDMDGDLVEGIVGFIPNADDVLVSVVMFVDAEYDEAYSDIAKTVFTSVVVL